MANTYVSPSRTFSFEYPDNWKLEREEGGTIVLWKKGGLFKKDSENNLRIKPLLADSVISQERYKAYVTIKKKEHRDLMVIDNPDSHIMNFHILKYRQESYKDTIEARIPLIQDFWELLINDRIFSCSFTAVKIEEDSPKTREERETAEQILKSIKLL